MFVAGLLLILFLSASRAETCYEILAKSLVNRTCETDPPNGLCLCPSEFLLQTPPWRYVYRREDDLLKPLPPNTTALQRLCHASSLFTALYRMHTVNDVAEWLCYHLRLCALKESSNESLNVLREAIQMYKQ